MVSNWGWLFGAECYRIMYWGAEFEQPNLQEIYINPEYIYDLIQCMC